MARTKEQIAAYKRAWAKQNAVLIGARQKEYRKNNQEEIRQYKAGHYQANKVVIRAKQGAYAALPGNRKRAVIRAAKHSAAKKLEDPVAFNEKARNRMSTYSATHKGKYRLYRYAAQVRDLSWSLTFESFVALLDLPCFYHGGSAPGWGVDRVDNSIGYEPGNVVPCCGMCNVMKLDWSLEEFAARVQLLASRVGIFLPKKKVPRKK